MCLTSCNISKQRQNVICTFWHSNSNITQSRTYKHQPINMKFAVGICSMLAATSALRVKRQNTDEQIEDVAAILAATGNKQLIVISDHALRFVQEEFMPMIELVNSQMDDLAPLALTAQIFDVVENFGVRLAHGANDYAAQIFTDESLGLTLEEVASGVEATVRSKI